MDFEFILCRRYIEILLFQYPIYVYFRVYISTYTNAYGMSDFPTAAVAFYTSIFY